MILRFALALLLLPSVAPAAPQQNQVSHPPRTARFALAQAATSWDPLAADSTANQVIQRQVYECLFEYKPQASPIATQPLLAESWQISEDRLTWSIRLRDNARFYDPFDPPLWKNRRRTVNAQDVVYSWLRMADGRLNGGGYWALQGLFEGLDDFHAQTLGPTDRANSAWKLALAEGIPGIRASDDRTVVLQLTHPDPNLMVRLASAYFAVYPQEAVQRNPQEFLNQPVGSGPYYMVDWIPKHQAKLRKTPQWRGQLGAHQMAIPQIEALTFTTVLENSTRSLLFEKGEIERLTPTQDSFNNLVIHDAPAPELAKRGVRLLKVPPAGLAMIAFNMDDPDLGMIPGDGVGNDQRRLFRQAIGLAFPYSRWHKVIRNGAWAQPAQSFLPPGLPETKDLPTCKYRRTDIPAAKALLIKAGWPNGKGAPELRYELAGNSAVDRSTGEIFKEAMRLIGIKVTIVANTWDELRNKMNRGEAQVFGRAWTMDWADPVNILELFYGPNHSPGINRSNYSSPSFDQAFRSLMLANESDRPALVYKMLEILNEDLPALPVDHRIGYLLLQPWLKGVSVHPFDPYACKFYRLER